MKTLIGVMGPGDMATAIDVDNAYQLGTLVAQQGWVLLTGGRNVGVMDAASRGAKVAGGLTVGILPTSDSETVSEAVDIAIVTDMGSARNNINVLSCQAVIACGMGAGTASEIALAIKNHQPVILLTEHRESQKFFTNLAKDRVFLANYPREAIELAKRLVASRSRKSTRYPT